MLGRYHMARGKPAAELPQGRRVDTRKHTRHALRPEADAVRSYLAGELDFEGFAKRYRAVLEARAAEDASEFDAIAALAETEDVYLGCSCPSRANPDVRRCHTWLALEWMAARYPDLEVRLPALED